MDRSRRYDAVSALTIYLVALYAIPSPMIVAAVGQVGGPSTILAVILFVWWLWHRAHRTDPWSDGAQPVRNAALVLLLVGMLTYVHSAGLALPGDERGPADGAILRLIGSVGLVCVLAEGVDDRDRLWVFCRRWAMGIGLISALAVIQIVTRQLWVDRLWLPGLTPPSGLELIQRGLILRPSATATHPLELSSTLAMTMPLVFAVAARERTRPRLYLAIALAVPVLILLTGSRTALVCGTVAFVVMVCSWPPRTRLLAAAGGVVMMAVMFVAVPGLLGSLRGLFSGASSDPSVTSRTNSYAVVGYYWDHHPWLGRGLGTFLPRYWIFDNMYLNLLVTGGVAIILAFAIVVLVASWASIRAGRLVREQTDKQLALAALGGTLAGAVSLALYDGLSFPQASGTLFLMIGLCGATYRLARAETEDAPAEVGVPRAAAPEAEA